MEIEKILTEVSFDSLNKLEWSVVLCNITDHVRTNPLRFAMLKALLLEWNANKTAPLPVYLSEVQE